MKKLNLAGKLAIAFIVIIAVSGIYFGAKSFSGSGAETTITGFATALESKNYEKIFESLSAEIRQNGSRPAFAENLAKKFGNTSLKLEKIDLDGKTGFAIFSNGDEYFTIPIVKEKAGWKINYFAQDARCTNKCSADYCKDDKTQVECKDTNSDSCTEEISNACTYSCTDAKCSLVQENFVLPLGGTISNFPKRIMLIDTDANKNEATLDVGHDIYIFLKGESQDIKGISITVAEVGKDKISLKAKVAE